MIQSITFPPRIKKESKEQVRALRRNFELGSSVLVAGTVSTALVSDTKKVAQIISDTVHTVCRELDQTKLFPKVKEAINNTKIAIKTMWADLPGKTSKAFVAATALGLATIAVKTIVDAVKVHQNNNVLNQ